MTEAGFVDVQTKIVKVRRWLSLLTVQLVPGADVAGQIPWGPWAKDPHLKEIGRFQYYNAIESVDSYGLALMTRAAGYTEEEAKIFLAIVKNQLRSKSLHAYNLMWANRLCWTAYLFLCFSIFHERCSRRCWYMNGETDISFTVASPNQEKSNRYTHHGRSELD